MIIAIIAGIVFLIMAIAPLLAENMEERYEETKHYDSDVDRYRNGGGNYI